MGTPVWNETYVSVEPEGTPPISSTRVLHAGYRADGQCDVRQSPCSEAPYGWFGQLPQRSDGGVDRHSLSRLSPLVPSRTFGGSAAGVTGRALCVRAL
jgi:hypothetical protein